MNPEADVMIANLKQQLALVPPGDNRRLDISVLIQEIQGSCLGGNLGHAQLFISEPEQKEKLEKRIEKYYSEIIGGSSGT